MNSTCVICNGPNTTRNNTCSHDCKIDLALALGHITDYPETDHIPTEETK